MASVFVLLEAFNRKEAAALGFFPCATASFSIAGSRKGFGDPRGTLFFELARLAEARKPSYLLFENVPGLLSHDGGRTFATIRNTLDRLGYGVEWQCPDTESVADY